MPKQINTYTFGQGLVRKFGLKGRFQPVLDETIVPVTVVDSDKAVRMAAGGALGVTSGAGNQNLIFFRNPPESGVLVRLTSWWAVSGAPLTDFVDILTGTTVVGAAGTGVWRDLNLAGIPAARFNRVASPAVAIAPPLFHLDNDDTQWYGDWVLREGTWMAWRQSAQNQTFDLSCYWEETDLTATLGA